MVVGAVSLCDVRYLDGECVLPTLLCNPLRACLQDVVQKGQGLESNTDHHSEGRSFVLVNAVQHVANTVKQINAQGVSC